LTQQVNNRELWPTPDVRGFSNEGAIAKLSKLAESWEEFSGMAHRKSQSQKRKHWPTPRAFMHKDSTTDRGKSNLGEVVGGQLNPMWVEALMGFPIGWTEIDN
jgi:hypothetical protein